MSDYDTDFYTWAREQAEALRSKKLAALDWQHLAEEIESLGHEQEHAVESHLANVLTHLLKWCYQPERRSRSWRQSALIGRQQIARRLKRNPGLQSQLATLLAEAYRDARKRAALETDLPPTTFPETSPWPLERVLDEDFLPEANA
jgi:hypothetical protein